MPNSSQQLHHALTHLNLMTACIGAFFITSHSTAANEVSDAVFEFQTTDCWVKLDSKAPTDCGWLKVPEDWENTGAKKLKLPVVIYRPLDPDPSLHPVIYPFNQAD